MLRSAAYGWAGCSHPHDLPTYLTYVTYLTYARAIASAPSMCAVW